MIHTGCADRGGGGQGKHRMGLGDGGPCARAGLAVSLAGQPVRFCGKFFGAAGNALARSLMLHVSHRLALEVIPPMLPSDLPYGAG